ncbi:unnamed protein product, partial [Meganyctiphanes norvegica]
RHSHHRAYTSQQLDNPPISTMIARHLIPTIAVVLLLLLAIVPQTTGVAKPFRAQGPGDSQHTTTLADGTVITTTVDRPGRRQKRSNLSPLVDTVFPQGPEVVGFVPEEEEE